MPRTAFCYIFSIPWKNIVSIATDGAPSMVGRHRGFIAHLKRQLSDVLVIYCVIHWQHLVAKKLSSRLHKSLQYVINTISKKKEFKEIL